MNGVKYYIPGCTWSRKLPCVLLGHGPPSECHYQLRLCGSTRVSKLFLNREEGGGERGVL